MGVVAGMAADVAAGALSPNAVRFVWLTLGGKARLGKWGVLVAFGTRGGADLVQRKENWSFILIKPGPVCRKRKIERKKKPKPSGRRKMRRRSLFVVGRSQLYE